MTIQPTQGNSRNRGTPCPKKPAGLHLRREPATAVRFKNARFAPPPCADIEKSLPLPFARSRTSERFGRPYSVEPIQVWLRRREGA